jgi:drug/metabolite transporter (DMT)-like permease
MKNRLMWVYLRQTLAVLVWGEMMYAAALLGGALIIAGVWLVNRPTKMQTSGKLGQSHLIQPRP